MTNTINNVPRELLERVLNAGWGSETVNALDDLRDFLASAPSPAGVDWLDVVGYISQDDIQWNGDCTLRLKPYSDYTIPLCRLSDAQAIIDGLRGEVERLSLPYSKMCEQLWAAQQQRDQLAELLRDVRKGVHWQIMANRIDAALAELPK